MFDNKNISKLYRYEALLQAIDFFTQKFDTKQLANYAFDFANEILTLNSSALFIKEGESFYLTRERNYGIKSYNIENTPKLQRIATFYGNILKSNFTDFFSQDDVDKFETKLIIPLIIQDLLYGFIVSNGKAVEAMDEDDLTISKALMQLINNSLENSKNFSDLQETNKQLDQKVFNLFSINQSSRMLLSELDLNKLYSLSIDIFSELTSSRITSFGIYDEIRDRIIIKGYRNVFCCEKYYNEFKLSSNEYNGYRIVYHYRKDKELLKKIFDNYEDFEKLDAEYIILIVKKKILGFVTISKPVNDRSYDEGLFELIESLAASTYISLTNAIFFQETSRQKNIIEQKLNVLTRLNSMIKNISSCQDIDELCDITVKTLFYGFGLKKVFIALREQNQYIIKNCMGFTPIDNVMPFTEAWKQLDYCSMFYKFTHEANINFFDKYFLNAAGDSNCLVIAPLGSDNCDLTCDYPPGFIVVLQTPESIKEEELMLVDTVSNSISPVINHLNQIEQLKKEYIIDQQNAFVSSLHKKFEAKTNFFIDFYIYYKKITQKPFTEPDLTSYKKYDYYYFRNYVFVLSEEMLGTTGFDGELSGASVDEIVSRICEF